MKKALLGSLCGVLAYAGALSSDLAAQEIRAILWNVVDTLVQYRGSNTRSNYPLGEGIRLQIAAREILQDTRSVTCTFDQYLSTQKDLVYLSRGEYTGDAAWRYDLRGVCEKRKVYIAIPELRSDLLAQIGGVIEWGQSADELRKITLLFEEPTVDLIVSLQGTKASFISHRCDGRYEVIDGEKEIIHLAKVIQSYHGPRVLLLNNVSEPLRDNIDLRIFRKSGLETKILVKMEGIKSNEPIPPGRQYIVKSDIDGVVYEGLVYLNADRLPSKRGKENK